MSSSLSGVQAKIGRFGALRAKSVTLNCYREFSEDLCMNLQSIVPEPSELLSYKKDVGGPSPTKWLSRVRLTPNDRACKMQPVNSPNLVYVIEQIRRPGDG